MVGDIARRHPVMTDDVRLLRGATDRVIKVTVPGPFTMSQQAQNDHYPDAASLALAYADAVRAEVHDLFAAGADIVQLDEPYMQARPEAARDHGLAALNRALQDASGTTAVHICFGYAAIIHERPEGYSFLPELAGCTCDQISIETAQSGLDLGVLADLTDKTIILGVLDLSDDAVEPPDEVARRARRAFDFIAPRADRARAGLRDEVPAAGERGRQAAQHGGRGAAAPGRGSAAPDRTRQIGEDGRARPSARSPKPGAMTAPGWLGDQLLGDERLRGQHQRRHRRGVLEAQARDPDRVDHALLEQVAEVAGQRVEAVARRASRAIWSIVAWPS